MKEVNEVEEVKEMIQLANNIFTQTALISLVIFVFIYIKEGKDERGSLIFNFFFRGMFTLLTLCITGIMLIDSWMDLSHEWFRLIISLSLTISYTFGGIYLLYLRFKF